MSNMNYSLGFVFDTTEKFVVLIRKNRPGWQKDCLNGVGGKIKNDESAIDCMIREFKEETGVFIPGKLWDCFCIMNVAALDSKVFCFVAITGLATKAKTTTDEEIYLCTIDTVNLMRPLLNLRWLIPMALSTDYNIEVIYKHSRSFFSKGE